MMKSTGLVILFGLTHCFPKVNTNAMGGIRKDDQGNTYYQSERRRISLGSRAFAAMLLELSHHLFCIAQFVSMRKKKA
ncbi:MAG: hypothetical protein ACRCU5_15480 [Rhizobiaceae bacterium]